MLECLGSVLIQSDIVIYVLTKILLAVIQQLDDCLVTIYVLEGFWDFLFRVDRYSRR